MDSDRNDSPGSEPHATLAAKPGSSSLETNRICELADGAIAGQINSMQGVHVLLDALLPAEESRDRYTLTQLHGRGGMGQVWLALDKALGRLIALKELRADQVDNKALRSRFLYEAKITSQLEHPGIVPVYELGQGEAPYYTMRFVRGRTLSDALRDYHLKRGAGESDSIAWMELLTAFVAVCHAIAYAHSRGIIHRDLKGQNVALGDFGEVMVLDWGLAKRVGPCQVSSGEGEADITIVSDAPDALPEAATTVSSRAGTGGNGDSTITDSNAVLNESPAISTLITDDGTSQPAASRSSSARPPGPVSATEHEPSVHGQILGTPGYMAPEQALGQHDQIDERTDVYGLGAILYEILTGRPPFLALRTPDIIRRICQEAPTPPRKINFEVEPGLEAICLKALGKRREDRYLSASELAQDMQRWLADEPVRAYREPWTRRVLRWGRRHRTLVAAAGGLLVTATIALALSATWVAVLRNEAETQAQQARHAVELLTKVAAMGFDDQPDPIQKEFLEEALGFYQQFTSRLAGNAIMQADHGRVYQQMGDIERKLGRFPQSEGHYRKAIEVLEPLVKLEVMEPEPARALARSRTLLADLLVRGGDDQRLALALYNQALLDQKRLAIAPAATPLDRLRLGQTKKSQADLIRQSGQLSEAKLVYDQAIAALKAAWAVDPTHPEVRNELANATDAHGRVMSELGDIKAAEQDYRGALAMFDALVAEFPTNPRYRESLARVCDSLGMIEANSGRLSDAEAHFLCERPLVERLAEDYPDRPEHKRELARTLMNLGNVLAEEGLLEKAQAALVRAIELFNAIAAGNPRDEQAHLNLARCHTNLGELFRARGEAQEARTAFADARSIAEKVVHEFPEKPRCRVEAARALLLNDFGGLQVALKPPEGEVILLDAIGAFESLVKGPSPTREDRQDLAIAHAALGSLLVQLNRLEGAGPHFTSSVAAFEALVAEHARSPLTLSYFGMVLEMQARWMDSSGKPEEAKRALALALVHQRRAVELGKNGDIFRERLGRHLLEFAWIELKLGADLEAAKIALDLPKTVPGTGRPRACFDAARILARVVSPHNGDSSHGGADYDRLTHNYVGRIAILLREAIDTDPKLAEPIKADPDIKRLASRPEFRDIIRALVDLGH